MDPHIHVDRDGAHHLADLDEPGRALVIPAGTPPQERDRQMRAFYGQETAGERLQAAWRGRPPWLGGPKG